jgi:hypothetical protein
MNLPLDQNTPAYLASLFTLLLNEGITPNQFVFSIVQSAMDTQELPGLIGSWDCFCLLLKVIPSDRSAQGVTDFIASLASEGITTFMLLDALGFACYVSGMFDSASIIRLTYQRLQADRIISQVLEN